MFPRVAPLVRFKRRPRCLGPNNALKFSASGLKIFVLFLLQGENYAVFAVYLC
jgi:hypothetical protein